MTRADIDGCAVGVNPCHVNAMCTDRRAPQTGATCACNTGYSGNGTVCIGMMDMRCYLLTFAETNGCAAGVNPCSTNAICVDNIAPLTGATCTCNTGFIGNGSTCTGLLSSDCCFSNDQTSTLAPRTHVMQTPPALTCQHLLSSSHVRVFWDTPETVLLAKVS